jgi:hypothetical protein
MRNLIELLESKGDVSRPWTMSGSMYLSRKGIHEPWIAEISPMQYAQMGKSAKVAYDRKRHKEWQAASDGKAEWAKLVFDSFKKGLFDKGDKDVHPEALKVLKNESHRRDEEQKKKSFDQAVKDNRITDLSKVKKGDTVFHVVYRQYGDVLRVSKKSLSMNIGGRPTNAKAGFVDWLSYGDLQKSFGDGK